MIHSADDPTGALFYTFECPLDRAVSPLSALGRMIGAMPPKRTLHAVPDVAADAGMWLAAAAFSWRRAAPELQSSGRRIR
jgi:hypothetical protein